MLMLRIVTSSLFVSAIWADVNFYFDKTCYSEQENIKLTAEYKGSGTVTAVQWYYSNKTVSNLIILASNCLIAGGSVPPGYPDGSRITTSCDLATKTFTLTLKGLQAEELKKSWGATFSLSADPSPDVKQETISICSSCKCDCEGCKTRVGICISFSCIGIAPEVIFVVGLFIASFSKTKLVVFAAIVIVIEIIGGGVCISVPMEKCCIECCENWYKPPSIGFAVVSFLVGVAGIAEFVLVLSNRIGPGRNGGNGFFCFNNGNDDGNDGGNDSGNNGHHRGRGTNSSTVHTEHTDTHRGTLSDRANSDGEVSRKDVHVQENRDNFSGRPMPPIPLTDKKGRGLSANYDDDHPMINVGIPERRAGDLGPLAEEPKKKKKKKKKAVNDDDNDE